jgi:hypothetical protein
MFEQRMVKAGGPMKYFLAFLVLISLSVVVSGATIIDFEAQTSHGANFDGLLDSPLVIGIATFTGGEVLGAESGSVDITQVYATNGGQSYANPIVIAFSSPVSGFSVLVTNNIGDTFTVADNVGDSQSMVLGGSATQVFTLSGVGITQVTVSEGGPLALEWDFAIDNVTFTTGAVPEPGTLALLGAGLAVIAFRKRGLLKERL